MGASTDSGDTADSGIHEDSMGISDPSAPSGVTQSQAFEILSNKRRRHVLHYLFQQENSISLRELSAQLAAWENDIPVDEVSYQQRRRVYTALRQVHLPKLTETDIIHYDSRQATAELTDEASELKVYLDVVPHNNIPWSTYYTGLGSLSCALLVGVSANLFPLRLISGLGWATIIALLFTGSALVHHYRERQMRLGADGEPPI